MGVVSRGTMYSRMLMFYLKRLGDRFSLFIIELMEFLALCLNASCNVRLIFSPKKLEFVTSMSKHTARTQR